MQIKHLFAVALTLALTSGNPGDCTKDSNVGADCVFGSLDDFEGNCDRFGECIPREEKCTVDDGDCFIAV
ncbi:Uu.00g065810.m01.CDS01 [Anthostomella pinea]|uniref:Uu.00g065810.m01.CDS01 n=1 Tax=Anthostomella pinea TaxID=933095 RepID=A0AAI8YNC2_9PEZI|nr:Uu.00g065810.m01.CDS01 [Anthostomella pinea]